MLIVPVYGAEPVEVRLDQLVSKSGRGGRWLWLERTVAA